MKLISKIVILGALLALSIGAFAQGRRGFGGMRAMFNNPYRLLRSKDVQTDLKLSDDQIKKLTDIQTAQQSEIQEAMQNASAAGGPPDFSAFQKINDKYNDQYKGVLTSDQDKRLHEINLQQQGSMALGDKDVQDQLGLSSDQKQKITDLMSQFDTANQQLMQNARDGSITREDAMTERQKNQATLKTQLAAVLTSDQNDKFKAMQGAPFTGKIEMGFGGRRGGGGRAGGGGGGGGIGRAA